MEKQEDLNPTDRQLTLDANRLLLPLFLVSTAPPSEAKEPNLQAGNVRPSPFFSCSDSGLLTNDVDR